MRQTMFVVMLMFGWAACGGTSLHPGKIRQSVSNANSVAQVEGRKNSWFVREIFRQVAAQEISAQKARTILDDRSFSLQDDSAQAIKAFTGFVNEPGSDEIRCNLAADLAYYFKLGSDYADKAINCHTRLPDQAKLACLRPGSLALQRQLAGKYIIDFLSNHRPLKIHLVPYPYGGFYVAESTFADMLEIAGLCTLDQEEYRSLLAFGIKTNEVWLTRKIFELERFAKQPEDFDQFFTLALGKYECGTAATVAFEHHLSDQIIESIFLDKRCFSGNLGELDPALAPKEKAEWLFSLCLRAQEFSLGSKVIKQFQLDKDHFNLLVSEGLKAHDYNDVLNMEPWGSDSVEYFRFTVFKEMLSANEELAMANFVQAQSFDFVQLSSNQLLELVFSHALFRSDYMLAAEIIARHGVTKNKDDGIRIAFESALQKGDDKSAFYIASRHRLGADYLTRVANFRRLKLLRAEQEKVFQAAHEAAEASRRVRERCISSRKAGGEWGADTCR
ncbi:MAG TPA: hypothetical protein VLK22_04260 [Candidatus Udaeobacter sp.]|nr:hypothetical protein [Candidatus Udaeobacter sp.]